MYFSFAPCTPHILQFHSSLCKFLYSAVLICLRTTLLPPGHLFVPSVLCMWLISPGHLINHTLCFILHSNISRKCSIAFYWICSVFFLHIIHMMFLRAEPIFKVLWPVSVCALLTKDQGWWRSSGMWCSVTGLIFVGFIFSGWWVQAEGQVWEIGRNEYVYQSSCWRL
jgi:hypothetical protein